MKKKKIMIIIGIVVVVAVLLSIFLIIFNKDSNKLKRYLKKEGYTCNEKLCYIDDDGVVNQINYHTGLYTLSGTTYLQIDPVKKSATYYGANVTGVQFQCNFTNKDAKELTKFTEDNTSSDCAEHLRFVNREVEKYQVIIVKSKTNPSKLK